MQLNHIINLDAVVIFASICFLGAVRAKIAKKAKAGWEDYLDTCG
jgi:hypothetical protein